jgi:hypothetical protein
MPGLVPGIHVLARSGPKGVDGRVKPGHDEMGEANKNSFHFLVISTRWG